MILPDLSPLHHALDKYLSDYHPNSADFFLTGILLKILEISPRCARRNDTLGCHLERSERSRAFKRGSG
jgi:hypothetical protein